MKQINYLIKCVLIAIIFIAVNANSSAQEQKKTDEIKIKTSAVCSMCKERIEKALAFEKGVKDVTLDVKTKICTIKYKPAKTNPENLRLSITKLGYDADDKQADPKAYEKLPACCKKGNAAH
ncbi:MAG: heavy-metal-associated domain-containing protein [Bacteroidia bacterium]|nr:heavy-metal-associated domain-containing protein [Bacteroidia bacterium]